MLDPSARQEKAAFAAGCFWDVEAVFRKLDGVLETVTGYTGGSLPGPGYDQVESGTTGHAEAVGLVFDPAVMSYEGLLDVFWALHDPTRAGGQGDYTGSQYRSLILYYNGNQKTAAFLSRNRLAASDMFRGRPILTEILPASDFWPAEECHQQFYEKCGRGYGVSHKIWE